MESNRQVQDWDVHEHKKKHIEYREAGISCRKELYQQQGRDGDSPDREIERDRQR